MVNILTYQPGDISRICYFHFKLSEKMYQFDGQFERDLLAGMAEVYDDTEGSQMWYADRDGEIVGNIAIIKRPGNVGQLRWFGVAESMQGEGLGKQLVETALEFCKAKGYQRVYLETLDFLKPARHIYAKYGFELIHSEPFGAWSSTSATNINAETWELQL